ncbi:hypothetical protein K2Z83_14410 [Oscillochloris sp. ZM17-4]|uniref:hypothetical protein n=1 Tax=Oscillochloris sp. ZM17-4 TaxID=2866714 RepID=UPI001C72C726|nr:hypothetical protein [Oscillochloris sp. ZM17-4]MBX0328869.1 hypothetical protein [Oscillochloris sp. ZM17-4]
MATFWLRQDLQAGDIPDRLVAAAHRWLREAWPLPAHLCRVNDAETRSITALGRAGLSPRFAIVIR